jgi:hypothetical protein
MAVFALGETLADVGDGGAATVEAVGVVELAKSAAQSNPACLQPVKNVCPPFRYDN